MVNELSETFESRDDKPAAIDRHAERVAWLNEHRAEVLEWLGLAGEDPALWVVEGLMVLDIELMSAHLVDTPLPVITYRELRNELAE